MAIGAPGDTGDLMNTHDLDEGKRDQQGTVPVESGLPARGDGLSGGGADTVALGPLTDGADPPTQDGSTGRIPLPDLPWHTPHGARTGALHIPRPLLQPHPRPRPGPTTLPTED